MKKLNKFISVILCALLILAPASAGLEAAASRAGKWVAAWGTSIVDGNISLANLKVQDFFPSDSTVRIELQVTTGGDKLKFKFSNEYGYEDITFGEVSAAKTVKEGKTEINTKTSVPVTFYGRKSITIPAGRTIWSDPIDMKTRALERISVSIFFNERTEITSTGLANARTFLSLHAPFTSKSQVNKKSLTVPTEVNISSGTITYHTTPFLAEIDTLTTDPAACSAVFIGDSTLVNNTYLHYAEKLVAAGVDNVGVINEAVIGNKLMSDGSGIIGNLYGKSLKSRFDRDALSITGVKYIFIKIGLNDIAHQFSKSLGSATPKLTPEQIIEGYKDITARAKARGIKVYFFTKSPWKGYERSFLGQKGDLTWNMTMQKMCDTLDSWVKNNSLINGYIDCSPLENPADKYAMCPSFTPDGAHLTDIASIALADLIPLSFAGADVNNAKTAAQIYNVDPYKEKKKIIYDMEHPTTAAPETEEPTEEPTEKPGDEPTEEPTETPTEAPTEAPSEALTDAPALPVVPTSPAEPPETLPPFDSSVTVPVINGGTVTPPPAQPPAIDMVEPDYDVSDTDSGKIGNGMNIGFLLVLFIVVIVAGVVLILILGKKREEEY